MRSEIETNQLTHTRNVNTNCANCDCEKLGYDGACDARLLTFSERKREREQLKAQKAYNFFKHKLAKY